MSYRTEIKIMEMNKVRVVMVGANGWEIARKAKECIRCSFYFSKVSTCLSVASDGTAEPQVSPGENVLERMKSANVPCLRDGYTIV